MDRSGVVAQHPIFIQRYVKNQMRSKQMMKILTVTSQRVMETGKMEDERREGGRLCVGVVYSRDLSTAAFFLCVCVCVYEREGE